MQCLDFLRTFAPKNMAIKRFNLRVYGLCVRDGAVLVSDEQHRGNLMTKFPGGGVELGEGIGDALLREFREEMDAEIVMKALYYINPFFQPSGFQAIDQVVSIYYLIDILQYGPTTRFSEKVRDFEHAEPHEFVYRWARISDLNPQDFTFPIDRVVVKKLLEDSSFLA